MHYTSHGHAYGLVNADEPHPALVALCGGPPMCTQCAREAAHICEPAELTEAQRYCGCDCVNCSGCLGCDTPEQNGGQATCACGLRAPEFRPDPTCPTHGGLQPGEQLRCGSQVGRTLYAHAADNPKGRLIGVMDTPELAALVVDSVNARPPVVLPADTPEDPR